MGFGAIRADGSRVSTFVFQFSFGSGWTNYFELLYLTSSSKQKWASVAGQTEYYFPYCSKPCTLAVILHDPLLYKNSPI
jgi:hypothetical protein